MTRDQRHTLTRSLSVCAASSEVDEIVNCAHMVGADEASAKAAEDARNAAAEAALKRSAAAGEPKPKSKKPSWMKL
jgi:hypothetical protein